MSKLSTLKTKNYFFWDMYTFLNSVHFKKGSVFTSKKNGKKYTLSNKKQKTVEQVISGLLWMTPALVLLYLVATLRVHFIDAILMIVVFHFASMWYLIRYNKMWK